MTTRLDRDQVSDLFWKARKRNERNSDIAANIVYDEGFRAGCEFLLLSGTEKAKARSRTKANPRRPSRLKAIADRARPVIDAVSQRHQTTPEAICGKFSRGPKANTDARDEAAWLLRRAEFSYPEIALALRLRCHTSAMDGCAKVEARIAERAGLRGELLALVAGERRLKAVG